MLRPRKGNTHTNRNGRVVVVPDHAYRDNRVLSTGEGTGAKRAGMGMSLSQLTSTTPPSHGLWQIQYRNELGVPLYDKAPQLETEIGVVEMTPELMGGFDNAPPPTSKDDANRMVREAAKRYAELSAYIAAKQGLSPEEMAKLKLAGEKRELPLPSEVIDALERTRSGADMPLEDRVVYTLDGTLEEDPKTIALAAEMYGMYIERNAENIFGENASSITQHNLGYALDIFSDTYYGKDEPVYGLDGTGMNGRPGGHACAGWVRDSGVEDVIRFSGSAPTTVPIVEKFPNGVRINITDDRSVEVTYGSQRSPAATEMWYSSIRRIVKTEDEDLVVASGSAGYEYGTTEAIMNAINFDRPLSRFWEKREVIGFKGGLR